MDAPLHGPRPTPGGARFRLWAPAQRRPAVVVGDRRPAALEPLPGGWWALDVEGAGPGDRYAFLLDDGREVPDPASPRQPDGVHGRSQLFDAGAFRWTEGGWRGLPLEALVLHELHVGTFTPEGTLDAAAERLPALAELGITCVELMPLQPFPGRRNWGYDGVSLHAVHEGYGGPAALQRFVDRAHGLGLAVCLDVVYNHLGPEGNYLGLLAPYFTSRHRTPWGDGLDLDGPAAGPVRALLVEAAARWVRDFRVDALRLDATHAIEDGSPRHLVAELAAAAHAEGARAGRGVHVIAESDENDRRVLDPPPAGWGCDAVWADDLHHALHALVTGERGKFLADFGAPERVAQALRGGFALQGEHSRYRGRPHGTSTAGLAPARFVTCLQNHDQVGNRPQGERIAALVPPEALGPLAAVVLLGSGTPLLFMGEEHGEESPFLYFTSHGDPALARAVSVGRRAEFIAEGAADVPDPQAVGTFERSRPVARRDGWHGELHATYRELLRLRRRHLPAIAAGWPEVRVDGRTFTLARPGLTLTVSLGPTAWSWAVREGPEA